MSFVRKTKIKMKNDSKNIPFVFFGTPELAVIVLSELKEAGFIPKLVVTAPDKPRGRGLVLTPPPVKVWAEKNGVPTLQPVKLDSEFTKNLMTNSYSLFIVAAYGKIIPKDILDIPEHGTLNVHPSLLPKFRGPSPVVSAILGGEAETGVSIMLLDEEMDHGPVIESEKIKIENEVMAKELEKKLAHSGGKLLAETIPEWVGGKIKAREQNHAEATYTKKVSKSDGEIDINGGPETNWRKYRAYFGWPGVYFFATNKKGERVRVIVKNAKFENGEFKVNRVLPEGGREMDYLDFARSLHLQSNGPQ